MYFIFLVYYVAEGEILWRAVCGWLHDFSLWFGVRRAACGVRRAAFPALVRPLLHDDIPLSGVVHSHILPSPAPPWLPCLAFLLMLFSLFFSTIIFFCASLLRLSVPPFFCFLALAY